MKRLYAVSPRPWRTGKEPLGIQRRGAGFKKDRVKKRKGPRVQ